MGRFDSCSKSGMYSMMLPSIEDINKPRVTAATVSPVADGRVHVEKGLQLFEIRLAQVDVEGTHILF